MNNTVVLRKSGGFYICFDNDAIIIAYLCNYKISNGRVGFPINTINKVTNLLIDNNINYYYFKFLSVCLEIVLFPIVLKYLSSLIVIYLNLILQFNK